MEVAVAAVERFLAVAILQAVLAQLMKDLLVD